MVGHRSPTPAGTLMVRAAASMVLSSACVSHHAYLPADGADNVLTDVGGGGI